MREMQLLGKQGQSSAGSKLPYYVVFAIFIVVPIVVLIAGAQYYMNSFLYLDEDTFQELYVERALNCFAVYDQSIERTTMVMDLAAVTDAQIDRCFSNSYKGILVTLEDDMTHQQLKAARNSVAHVPDRTLPYPVLYWDGVQVKRGILKVAVSRAGAR